MIELRVIVLWSLLLVLPLQTLGAIWSDFRGAAHFHNTIVGRTPTQQDHVHSNVEHHHHDDEDHKVNVVLAPEADHHHDALPIEEGVSGGGSTISQLAIIQTLKIPDRGDGGALRPNTQIKPLKSRSLARIERPPSDSGPQA